MKASQLRTRSIGYNAYREQETDTLLADEVTHLITETRDAQGRSTGYVYSKDGSTQQTVTTGYGTDGRIATAGFLHGGVERQFSYAYLPGSNLLQTMTMPCNMTLTQGYETQRDLIIGMAYHRGNTLVTQRTYCYDTLGRPLSRNTARNGQTENDSFVHNSRSELTSATVNGVAYGYDYDNIGNRMSAIEDGNAIMYDSNALNQYSAITENGAAAFVPLFDADGNQTRIKTSTGIWITLYNAENRPICFTNEESNIVVECSYDSMGRRAYKKVTSNGTVTLHQRFLYHGFQQIACIDLTRSNHPALWYITWDPTQPVTPRPLAIQINGTWYTYGWDITKNICELYSTSGSISLSYAYTPFGSMTASGRITQHIQWSSEFYDDELGLSCYNYRYYNPVLGKWINRDFIDNNEALKNLYMYCFNNVFKKDLLGLYPEDASLALFLFYMANPVPGKLIDGPKPEIERFEGAIYDIETLLPGIAAEIFGLIVNKHEIPKNVQDQIDEEVKLKIKIEVTQNKKNQGESKDVYRTHRGYDFYDVLFALGGGTVYTESEYSYSWCGLPSGRNISYDWHAKMNIYYADIFIEPFYTKIRGYGIGIQKMESGNPFAYFHNWTDTDAIPLKNRGFVDV